MFLLLSFLSLLFCTMLRHHVRIEPDTSEDKPKMHVDAAGYNNYLPEQLDCSPGADDTSTLCVLYIYIVPRSP